MRDELLGYLLKALDDDDREIVAANLAREPALQRDLETLQRGLAPLGCDKDHHEPPPQLAARTCEFVRHRSVVMGSAILIEPPVRSDRWTMQDLSVAAGIFVAATLLFLPAFSHSRFNAQMAVCQNNLRMIGVALLNYSQLHGDHFPEVPFRGTTALAGNYAPRLLETGFLPDSESFHCPGAPQVTQAACKLPTCRELEHTPCDKVNRFRGVLGGSYAYGLGFVEEGQYHSPKNGHRTNFVVVADEPGPGLVVAVQPCSKSDKFTSGNHCGRGQNVWCEDGHVQFVTSCQIRGCKSEDNIFTNDDGDRAPGRHRDDSVLAPGVATIESASVQ